MTNFLFVKVEEVAIVVRDLSRGRLSWSEVEVKFPKFEQQETTKVKADDEE